MALKSAMNPDDIIKGAPEIAKVVGPVAAAIPLTPIIKAILGPLKILERFRSSFEGLHTMRAALLANAASPENGGKISPGFIAILKQMAPDEGALLNALYDD